MSTIAWHSKVNMSETFRDRGFCFQTTTNRKWHMGYHIVTWPITSRDAEGAVRQYSRLSQRQLGFSFLYVSYISVHQTTRFQPRMCQLALVWENLNLLFNWFIQKIRRNTIDWYTKMNDLDFRLEVVYVMSTIAWHSKVNMSETVRDRGFWNRLEIEAFVSKRPPIGNGIWAIT